MILSWEWFSPSPPGDIWKCLGTCLVVITGDVLWAWRSHPVLSCIWLLTAPWTVTRLLSTWNSPGKNTGVGRHFLLQGIFLTQGPNPWLLCLLHWQMDSLPLVPPGKPWMLLNILLWPGQHPHNMNYSTPNIGEAKSEKSCIRSCRRRVNDVWDISHEWCSLFISFMMRKKGRGTVLHCDYHVEWSSILWMKKYSGISLNFCQGTQLLSYL